MLLALLPLYETFVRPPANNIPSRIRRDWGKMYYFSNVRGAIDGTHILAHVPSQQQASYWNQKGTISQNILAGCSFDMYFFYVCSGWEGSANDARVLENAELHGFPHQEGTVYLADAGYGLRKGFLTPYHTVRYHLREQACAHLRPQTKEELFNIRHAQLRNVIERILGVIRRRFHILNTAPEYSLKVQAQLVLVICALHNFIRHRANSEDDEFYKQSRQMQNESEGGRGSDMTDSTEQVNGYVHTSDMSEMVAERDRLATEMWVDYVNYQNRSSSS